MKAEILCFVLLGLKLAVNSIKMGIEDPNIILIIFDDLGWRDIEYHGSEFKTPNINRLAQEGNKLENFWTQPLCSPSRSQAYTGRNQIHTGVPAYPVYQGAEIGGFPLHEKLLSEVLNETGYSCHMIGKWHGGHSSLDLIPTGRGFETFLGMYLGRSDDHFHHSVCLDGLCGYDMHDDRGLIPRAAFELNGTYSTWAYRDRAVEIIQDHDTSKPLFLDISFTAAAHTHALGAPQEYIDMFPEIEDMNRRILGGQLAAGDKAVGDIVQALREKGMWHNTVLIFTSDNGGHYPASNDPLKGIKGEYWSGGIKATAFINSPHLIHTGIEHHGLFHISDLFTTICNLAGADISDIEGLDGHDIWDYVSWRDDSPRNSILHHIDHAVPLNGENWYPETGFNTQVQASYTFGPWRIYTGTQDYESDKNLWLFNIDEDPSETTDLSEHNPKIVKMMLNHLAEYNKEVVPARTHVLDPAGADPHKPGGNGAWLPWLPTINPELAARAEAQRKALSNS